VGLSGELRDSPAAERNKEPLLRVLRGLLPEAGLVLELASGTGQHVAYFAAALPALCWQPTDCDEEMLAAIERRLALEPRPNVRPPLRLDVSEQPWPVDRAAAVLCSNLIHIAPWAAAEGLFEGASAVLAPGAPLVLYGPYRIGGWHTAPSNEAFDASLRARNPDWGVRDLDDVVQAAGARGLKFEQSVEMPANNLTVVFRRA
jgi:SAM-dependent methyltransferase